jgi:simple sugar transport system permease protein
LEAAAISPTRFISRPFHFHRPGGSRCAACGLVQHWRRRPGLCRWPGVGIVALALDKVVPWYITFPAIAASALFGALWAFIPAYLQAYRGSHIVITTIMFNYIAGSLMVFMLNGPLKPLGSMAPQTRPFEVGAQLPKLN